MSTLPSTRALGGRYRVVGQLGAGGMATVYRAHDDWLKREVAVKVIAPLRLQDAFTTRRFRREAQLAARLTHQNIVRILDAGFDPQDFIVMELVEGVDAAKLVKRTGCLSLRHTLRLVGPICDALHHAHGKGVIHGDVSTSNILIREGDGMPKLADFGLAYDTTDPRGERPGKGTGTPGYMAPEVLDGAAPSPRSDLYAIAAVTRRLLTPAGPGAAVADAVGQALSRDPDDRQASVAEFRAQLIREAPVPFSLAIAA
jgi:serine/threonine protein kinase